MAERLLPINPALFLPNPSSTAPRTPPRPRQSTDAIVNFTPQSAHITSQSSEVYSENSKAPEQEEWLKEDLKSTTFYAGTGIDFGSQPLILGDILYRARSVDGRGTIVIEAAPDQAEAWLYAAKFSFPPATCHSEASLIWSALRTSKQRPEWYWVENNLPNLKFWEDVELAGNDEDFPHERIKVFMDEYCPDFGYEKRVLRILVQDKLEPLTSLREEVHYAQVFCDVLQAHRWLYDRCRILHRDISMNNIMVRKVDGKIFGVLNDLDLASRVTKEMSATSKHRTGTRPFMAYELLDSDPKKLVPHLYRHDLESLFYVMLFACCRYNLDGESVSSLYDEWLTDSAENLSNSKEVLCNSHKDFNPPVTPDFSGFSKILTDIREIFCDAQYARSTSRRTKTSFDPETVNGTITYEKFLAIVATFGEQKFPIHHPQSDPQPDSLLDEFALEEEEIKAKMGEWLDEDSCFASSEPSGKGKEV
ncbi:hypothetical protein K435DRAFT_844549 [Dendrothele bispora CBS 962.96]|uniref:Fungal-type protein kinase domain-containing protein n=1 Tax=Dendrothele bispora (strain CBS 962.96) TaxID=1314807 RepID=A0A4S8L0R1_DENBC|nr:hypothetical protein K435DRAFT_844549 [Dendrothele bispora CBS 962.96]